MKKTMLIPVFILVMWSCNNNSRNRTNASPADSLATNPHAIPSHVDTITHEDGLNHQSQIPSDTSATKGRGADSFLHK
jgi:hypothetical protein